MGVLGEEGHSFTVALRYQNVELALSGKFSFKSLVFHFKREGWHHCFCFVSHTSQLFGLSQKVKVGGKNPQDFTKGLSGLFKDSCSTRLCATGWNS